jgi:predicted Fe-S protein YdhL (DUF1289 family)
MQKNLITSPCISVCVFDGNDVCEGCYRSAEEITNWSFLDDEEREEVLRQAAKRFRDSGKAGLL